MQDDSIVKWLSKLRHGDAEAVQPLWERYFDRLVRLANQRLKAAPRRVADEEDIALSAFQSFCNRAMTNRIPQLADHNALWPLLVAITARKAAGYSRKLMRQKRGSGRVRGDSIFSAPTEDGSYGFQQVVDKGPTPEFAVQVADQLQFLVDALEDPVLRMIALKRLEGYSNREIAGQLNTTERTVHRKLAIIRSVWQRDAS